MALNWKPTPWPTGLFVLQKDIFSLLYDRLHQEIYDNHVIHADESPVKVMRPDGGKMKNDKKTSMWIYHNTPSSLKPVVLFEWQSSRRTNHPREFLKGFTGTPEKVDAYFAWIKQKYAEVGKQSNIGRALAYSIHQEKYLRTFLNDGLVSMDNNYSEQAIRKYSTTSTLPL